MAKTSVREHRKAGYGRDGRELTGTFGDDDGGQGGASPWGDAPFVYDDEDDGQLSQAQIAQMKRAAKNDPANQNPARSNTNMGPTAGAKGGASSTGTVAGITPPTQYQTTTGVRRLFNGNGPGRGKGNLAGFAVGFFLTAIALNMLESGPAAGWQWVKAKFINEVPGTGSGTATNTSAASTSNVLSGFTTSLDAVSTIAPGASSSPGASTTLTGNTPTPTAPAGTSTAVLV